MHDQNLRYTTTIVDCSRNQQGIETRDCEETHKIITLITKIQIKHKHNNKQLSIKCSQGTQTQLSPLAFLLHKGTQTPKI